jgi:hypothetical protein
MRALVGAFAIVVAPVAVGVARADVEPRMRTAREKLVQAKAQIAKTPADKAGHRAKATEQINKAIAEVEQGMMRDKTPAPAAKSAKKKSTASKKPASSGRKSHGDDGAAKSKSKD